MNAYIGKYDSVNVACSKGKNIIEKSSGGGVITSILINTLKNKSIDAAVVIGMNKEKPYLHEVKLAKNKDDIIQAAGSKYVLINFQDIIKKINENKDKRLAVTALPCHAKAIRKLQQQGKLKNVKLILGLFCGYNMPFDATLFLLANLDIRLEDIKELKYRGGNYPGGFLVKLTNGKQKFLPKHYYDFLNLMFVPKGCLDCKDYTNELAEVSVGDSWGHDSSSLMIIRNNKIKYLLENIEIKQITDKEFMKMHIHNIKHKKQGDSLSLTLIRNFLKTFKSILPIQLLGTIAKIRRKLK